MTTSTPRSHGREFDEPTPHDPPRADATIDEYDRFGPYRVYECLGAGGMASVHRATLEVADGAVRDIALKRLLPQLADDQKFIRNFIREAKLAAQLHHANIVKILELGRIGRTYYIAMELVAGQAVTSVLKRAQLRGVTAPIGVVISLLGELCDVLDYVANFTDEYGEPCPIVHRDLSPSNLIVGDDGHLHVIDFGVAKAITGKFMTNTGLVKGKLGYLAPESLAGNQSDARVDIFSAGVVMWELLTGRRLFSNRDELALIEQIRTGAVLAPSLINPLCPPDLDKIVLRALARDPEQRWRSAAVMRAALQRVRGHACTPRDVARWLTELHGFDGDTQTLATRDLVELLDEGELDRNTADLPADLDETKQEVDVKIYFNHRER